MLNSFFVKLGLSTREKETPDFNNYTLRSCTTCLERKGQDPSFFDEAAKIARRYGINLIFDNAWCLGRCSSGGSADLFDLSLSKESDMRFQDWPIVRFNDLERRQFFYGLGKEPFLKNRTYNGDPIEKIIHELLDYHYSQALCSGWD